MPKFRFEISGQGENAASEQDLPSEAVAGERAVELASETASAASSETARAGSSVRVYDDAGYLVAAVNISDLLAGGSDPATKSEKAPLEEPGVMRSG